MNSLKWLKFVFKEPQFKSQDSMLTWIRAKMLKPWPLFFHLTVLIMTTKCTRYSTQPRAIFHKANGLSFQSVTSIFVNYKWRSPQVAIESFFTFLFYNEECSNKQWIKSWGKYKFSFISYLYQWALSQTMPDTTNTEQQTASKHVQSNVHAIWLCFLCTWT